MSTERLISHLEIFDTLTRETVTSTACENFVFHSFNWTDGNFSCDCNRFIFFIHAKDPDVESSDEADEYPCDHGTPRFRVRILDHSGQILFDDTEDANHPFYI